ncbi:uncharacterized protein LOC129733250 [Wyeomyia smithii]|uniref:uncharacterized protein LOC129733250 n=1 Tax=Wyeomyia smithii TaxID=174621 RepID=UPI002467D9B2|nr:uncharacterized protein LOC129733250 [Wyeomyia smithii]
MFSLNRKYRKTEEHRCELCGGLFGRNYLLRSHQQKIHGVVCQQQDERKSRLPPSVTTLMIPAIKTPAMMVAKSRGEVPFAVLHMINEIPLIVRVLEQGDYSILKAAESSDFRESQPDGLELEEAQSVSIAVVATIYQKETYDGQKYFAITGPVSCYQTQEPIAMAAPEATDGEQETFMQESLGSANLYKTLTQLNAPEVVVLGREEMPRRSEALELQPSKTGNNQPKRKYQRKSASLQPPKKAPRQPKVITVVDDLRWWDKQNIAPSEPFRSRAGVKNFQDIATGSLLSPDRKSRRTVTPPSEKVEELLSDPVPEEPFTDLNVLDLIQVEEGMLPENVDVEISREEMFESIV